MSNENKDTELAFAEYSFSRAIAEAVEIADTSDFNDTEIRALPHLMFLCAEGGKIKSSNERIYSGTLGVNKAKELHIHDGTNWRRP